MGVSGGDGGIILGEWRGLTRCFEAMEVFPLTAHGNLEQFKKKNGGVVVCVVSAVVSGGWGGSCGAVGGQGVAAFVNVC